MHPKLNNINWQRRISRYAHLVHKDEVSVFVRTSVQKSQFSDEYYRRVHHTYHGVEKEIYECDSDYMRSWVDERSRKLRGYDTTEY